MYDYAHLLELQINKIVSLSSVMLSLLDNVLLITLNDNVMKCRNIIWVNWCIVMSTVCIQLK